MAAGRFHEAELVCRRALAKDPRHPDALTILGSLAFEAGQAEAGEALFHQALREAPEAARYREYAEALKRVERVERAVEVLEEGVGVFPGDAGLLTYRGQLLRDLGRSEEAEASLARAVELDPGHGAAHYTLSMMRRFEPGDPRIAEMEAILLREDLPDQQRCPLLFALGRAKDSAGDHAGAFRALEEANRLRRARLDHDPGADRSAARTVIRSFDRKTMRKLSGNGHPSTRPVLVVGMPRSGTTLVEQILHAHPQVHGAGELMELSRVLSQGLGRFLPRGAELPQDVARIRPEGFRVLGEDYDRALAQRAPAAARVVDKQLFNFTFIGLFHLMLPEARVIFCRRDPMDNGLSCFMSLFDAGAEFIYDLAEFGQSYRTHLKLMEHWQRLIPDRIHTVDYEELVANPEERARALVEALDLDWDPACLAFHSAERVVGTQSADQVRRPIYADSVGRWKAYEPWLGPLTEALAD